MSKQVLQFEQRTAYGKTRFYPKNAPAQAIVDLTGRKCLNATEIARLMDAGFTVESVTATTATGAPC